MKKVGLVLEGGGGRGAYQIGVWRALRESGLEEYIAAVSGSSVGGLNAALFIQNDLEKAEKIWNSISPEQILTPRSKSKNKRSAPFERDGLEKIIDNDLDIRCFDNSKLNCWMTCVRRDGPDYKGEEIQYIDYEGKKAARKYVRGRTEYFNLKYVRDENTRKKIILATSAMPIVFPEEEIEGNHYGDGGARIWRGDNAPIAPLALVDKCEIILVVHLTPVGTEKEIDKSKYPVAKIHEIFPKKGLGKAPGIDGMFDFTAAGAQVRMDMGYDELIDMLRSIKEDIESVKTTINMWEESTGRETIEQEHHEQVDRQIRKITNDWRN